MQHNRRGPARNRQRRGHWFAARRPLARHPARPAPAPAQPFDGIWQAVLEATQQGAWDYDARADIVRHSQLWKALLGYADEPVGNTLEAWMQRIHPDDVARVRADMASHWRGDVPFYENIHRIRHRDGSYHWVLDRGRVVERAADGHPLRIIGTKLEASQRQLFQLQLDQLAENVPGMLYQYQLDPDGSSHFPYASAGAVDIYGLTPDELRTDAGKVFERLHPDDRERGILGIQASARTLGIWQAEYRVNLPGRGERWLSGYAKPQKLDNGSVLWHGYIRDITTDKQQELKLRDTERLLQRLMNEMPIGLCLVDESGHFYFRNRRFHDYFGFPEDVPLDLPQWWRESYPDPDYRIVAIRDWREATAHARNHDGEIPRKHYRITLRDGSERIMAIGGLTFGNHFMATFEDRTEQQAQSERLQQLAYIDGLTGIANRRHFDETLLAEWRRCQRNGKPLSLLMFDIDHFKAYNDLYGHQQGDECLQAVAACLHAGLLRAQDLAARYGGEEFVCLLPECDASGALRLADSLRQSVQARALAHAGSPVAPVVTVSVGVATRLPTSAATPDTLIAQADRNLYRAKRGGRNRTNADGDDNPGKP